MYSHDTFGLGHLTRTLRVARTAIDAIPGSSVLVFTGSPLACRARLPQGIECVKLPSVTKRGHERYAALQIDLSFRRLREMRVRILRESLRLYRPHLLFVDNVPIGMKGELLPALEGLRRRRPDTRIHLNLRDVLDDPEVIRAHWRANGIHSVLQALYDEIHVFGDATVHDSIEAYGLPPDRTRFMGYIAPAAEGMESTPRESTTNEARRVLVTIGGGGDGIENIHCVLDLQRRLGAKSPFRFEIVLGPFTPGDRRVRIETARSGVPGVNVHEHVDRLAEWMPGFDVVVSMGGYNTLCEVMARARRSIAIPRIEPRREQLIRAEALEARGLLRTMHPAERSPERLEQLLHRSLDHGPVLPCRAMPPLNGLGRLADRLRELRGTSEAELEYAVRARAAGTNEESLR
jgi:predicted glycosyltransferase